MKNLEKEIPKTPKEYKQALDDTEIKKYDESVDYINPAPKKEMKNLDKEFDKKYKGKLEIETEDGLRYFVDEEVKSFIRQREKELLKEHKEIFHCLPIFDYEEYEKALNKELKEVK